MTPEKVRVRSGGRSLLRLDRGGSGGAVGPLTPEAQQALDGAAAVLVADYGRGVASAPGVREALDRRRRRPHAARVGPAPARSASRSPA